MDNALRHGTNPFRNPQTWMLAGIALIVVVAAGVRALQPRLALTITAPTTVTSGDVVTAQVFVHNAGRSTVRGATLTVTMPTTLALLTTAPKEDADTLAWNVPALRAGESFTVHMEGVALAEKGDTASLSAALSRSGARAQQTAGVDVAIARRNVGLGWTERGTLTVGVPATLGLTVSNDAATPLERAVIALAMPEHVRVIGSSPALAGDRWDVPAVPAGASSTFSVTVVADSASPVTVPTRMLLMVKGTQALLAETSLRMTAVTAVSVADVATSASSGLMFTAEPKYMSDAGIQLGFGPLPPRVGQTTTYRVFWAIHTDGRTAAQAHVTATLPQEARWESNGSVTGGQEATYDAATRTVRWVIGDLSASQQTMLASFDISITPQAKDVGKQLLLLGVSTFSAETVDGVVRQTAPQLTTATGIAERDAAVAR